MRRNRQKRQQNMQQQVQLKDMINESMSEVAFAVHVEDLSIAGAEVDLQQDEEEVRSLMNHSSNLQKTGGSRTRTH